MAVGSTPSHTTASTTGCCFDFNPIRSTLRLMIRKRKKSTDTIGGLALAGQAMHLLQKAPRMVWLVYLLGTAPFCIGLLYFWADMSRSAFAYQRCLPAALTLAILFVWMKCWHTVFTSLLKAHIRAQTPARWSWRRGVAVIATQTAIQPLGLLAIPITFCLAFPFYAVLTFYQNITILGDGRETNLRYLMKQAWAMAIQWPKQNHILIWLVSPWVLGITMLTAFTIMWAVVRFFPAANNMQGFIWFLLGLALMFYVTIPLAPFGCAVAGNIALLLAIAPTLSRTFLGMETVFSLSGIHGILNTTFLMTVFALTYACLDPIAKAAYVLRCFYSESQFSGRDLLVDLRRLHRTSGQQHLVGILVFTAMLWGVTALHAEPDALDRTPPIPQTERAANADAVTLGQAIQKTLRKPEYTWRMPRQLRQRPPEPSDGIIESFFQKISATLARWGRKLAVHLERFFEWLAELLRFNRTPHASDLSWHNSIRILLFGVLATVAALLGILLYRLWKQRRYRKPKPMLATPVDAAPDIEDEALTADQLPPNAWFMLADELLQANKLRPAIRALFLGSLAEMAQRNHLRISTTKTNRDYVRELERRAHDLPDAVTAFHDNTTLFEAIWYGSHPATKSTLIRFQSNLEMVLA